MTGEMENHLGRRSEGKMGPLTSGCLFKNKLGETPKQLECVDDSALGRPSSAPEVASKALLRFYECFCGCIISRKKK